MLNKTNLIIILILCATFVVHSTHAQKRGELEKEREKTQKEIEYAEKLLKNTQQQREKSVGEYVITTKKIELRQKSINQVNSEIRNIESNINTQSGTISELHTDIEMLINEYIKIIQQSYKNYRNEDKIMYVLASSDLNQAYRRIKYLTQYSRFRKEQIKLIEQKKQEIELQVNELTQLKNNKNTLLGEYTEENRKLTSERTTQEKTMQTLITKEKQLKKELAQKQQQSDELKRQIEKIIAEEIRKSNKSKPGAKTYQLTPEEKLLNDQFSANINRLPWPLERGLITEKFGEHNHPVLKGIKVRNDGIDITTDPSEKARSVFNGTVKNVFLLPGMNRVVIVRHGSYLTVYGNLTEVMVKPGENIKTKQHIGTLAVDENSKVSILKFQIWKENEKLDPEKWLIRGN